MLRWWPVVFASWYLVFLWQDTFVVKFTKDAKIYSILYMIIHVYTLFSMHEYNQVFLYTYSTVAFLIFIMSFMYIFLLHTLLNHRFQGIEYNTAVEIVLTMFNPILPFTVPALPSYEWGSIPTSPGAPRQVPVVI